MDQMVMYPNPVQSCLSSPAVALFELWNTFCNVVGLSLIADKKLLGYLPWCEGRARNEVWCQRLRASGKYLDICLGARAVLVLKSVANS